MSDKTLYLIQSAFTHTDAILNQLNEIYSANDSIVLMTESVLFTHDVRLNDKQAIYIIENDAEILEGNLPTHFKVISYDQFADIILDFSRCISLK